MFSAKMIVFMVILSLAAGSSAHLYPISAASDAQIRFAKENKYDGTGPGAEKREYAYKTYQTLDDALVAFADDPDTILPEEEKRRVVQKLVAPPAKDFSKNTILHRYQPKTVDEYTGYKPPKDTNKQVFYTLPRPYEYQIGSNGFGFIRNELQESAAAIKVPRISYHQESPLSVSRLKKTETFNSKPFRPKDFDSHPQYKFSYGVHDRGTGDSKSAHESRDGDTVHGYYTFMDPDGLQRTVQYTADDANGFRAIVQRSHTNTQ